MIRRPSSRVRRSPRWEAVVAFPETAVSLERERSPRWSWIVVAGGLAACGWWFWRAPQGAAAEIPRPKTASDIQSVEISPIPPQPQSQTDEIQEAPTTNSIPTSEPSAASAPSVGLVDAGAAGGSGNGLPGLDLGLEGNGAGMAVAAGGGGSGHGVGTGVGNGVGSQRMVYQLGQVDQDASTDRIADPPYPRRAKEDGVEASLELRILVDERGRVEKLEVLGAPPGYGFESALENSSRSWRFRPAQLGGVPVPQWVRMPYSFHLN